MKEIVCPNCGAVLTVGYLSGESYKDNYYIQYFFTLARSAEKNFRLNYTTNM